MAKRKFTLPGIQDLSKEQEDARALPKKGQHLIIGGPGTGKSVLALLRSRRHHDNNDDYIFLVYNRLLHQASRHLFGPRLISKTWNSWFTDMFFKKTGQSVPLLPAPSGNNWQDINWDQIFHIIGSLDANNQINNLKEFKLLLTEILKKWPDVEFKSTMDLDKMIRDKNE